MKKRLFHILLYIINLRVNVLHYDNEIKDGAILEKEYVSRFRLFRLLVIEEQRDSDGKDFKNFIHIYLFGIEIINWVSRDEYRRAIWVRELYD
jgi:hypothetical protein